MELNEYQEKAMATCMPTSNNLAYMLFGLGEEVGEAMGKISKGIRKGFINVKIDFTDECPDDWRELFMKELGDCEWMLSGVQNVMGMKKNEVCQQNLDKLASRQQRNVIDGNGDNR